MPSKRCLEHVHYAELSELTGLTAEDIAALPQGEPLGSCRG
jgi:hypothetical protein